MSSHYTTIATASFLIATALSNSTPQPHSTTLMQGTWSDARPDNRDALQRPDPAAETFGYVWNKAQR